MTVLTFKAEEHSDLQIPSFELHSGEAIRLETRSPDRCRELLQLLESVLPDSQIVSVWKAGRKRRKKGLLKSHTIESYLQEYTDLAANEIDAFSEDISFLPKTKLSSLVDNAEILVYLKSFYKTDQIVLVSDLGMHVYAMQTAYKTLGEVLGRGGSCIIVTYPPFEDEKIDSLLGVKPRVILAG